MKSRFALVGSMDKLKIMLGYKELLDAFRGSHIPEKLTSLYNFSKIKNNENSFLNGFKFHIDKRRVLLKKYSDDKNFLNSIYEFASADTCGSIYAFWVIDDNCNLDDAPIVTFDGEGEGVHVVANTLDDFLKIISHKAEPYISWENVSFYYEPYYPYEAPLDEYEILNRDRYLKWLKKEYNICPVDDDAADHIIDEAHTKYGNEFSIWLRGFNIEEKEEEAGKLHSFKPIITSQEATERLNDIRSQSDIIGNKEIKKYIKRCPDKLRKFGKPQDKYRYGFYGSNSMEYDTWGKFYKK